MRHQSWYVRGADEPVVVPRPAPSIREMVLRIAVLGAVLSVWAVVQGRWLPLVILAPAVVLMGPVPWRRFFFENRVGSALSSFAFAAVAFAVVIGSLLSEGHSAGGAVGAGVLFGVLAGISDWFNRGEEGWTPERFRQWLRFRRSVKPR